MTKEEKLVALRVKLNEMSDEELKDRYSNSREKIIDDAVESARENFILLDEECIDFGIIDAPPEYEDTQLRALHSLRSCALEPEQLKEVDRHIVERKKELGII